MTDKRLELMWQIERSRANGQHCIVVITSLLTVIVSMMPHETWRAVEAFAVSLAAMIGSTALHWYAKTERDQ